MKTSYSFLILIIISFCANAQESGWLFSKKVNDTTELNPGFMVGIAPLALIDVFDGMSARPTVEVPLSKRVTVGAEVGFIFFSTMYKENARGYIIKPILKYYINPKKQVMRYFALEYMYKEHHYYLTDSLKNHDVRSKRKYNMDRKAVAFTLKYGQVSKWKGIFDIDWYVGGGVRFQNSVSQLTPEEERSVLTGLDPVTGTDHGDSMVAGLQRQSGVYVYPNITAGLKLMFNFSRFRRR